MTRSRRTSANPRQMARQQRKQDKVTAAINTSTELASIFKPLSDKDVLQIHNAALNLLEEVGIADPTERVKDVALKHGCKMNQDGRLIFPRAIVEDVIDKAAKRFVLYGRDSTFDFEASTNKINFCTGGAAVLMLDIDQRKYRPSTLIDLYDLARLGDTLENIQWFTRPVVATEIENLYELDVNTIYACVAGTQKHIATSFTQGHHITDMLPMLDALALGGQSFSDRPYCTAHATTIVSPMTFAQDSLDVACAAVDVGMPVNVLTGPQAGATAPAALAGTLVQGCAESLGSLCIVNMLKPGHPVILSNWTFVSDLRTGAFTGGGGEQALLGAASGQMAAFYGIPGGVGAGMSDSKVPDNQAGFEKALTTMAAALSGGGFVYESTGMLSSLLGCSLEAMIIDDDMLSNIRRIARGIEVTDETLSISVVSDTVDGPGHFLGHSQTLELMESEYVYPRQADRMSPSDWEDAGAKDAWDRATEQAKRILTEHHPEYIDNATDDYIRNNYPIKLPKPNNNAGCL